MTHLHHMTSLAGDGASYAPDGDDGARDGHGRSGKAIDDLRTVMAYRAPNTQQL